MNGFGSFRIRLVNKFSLLSQLNLVVSFHSNLYAQEVLFISVDVGGLNLALPFSKRRSYKTVCNLNFHTFITCDVHGGCAHMQQFPFQ